MIRVLFLCLGNICRSPMAEAVFRDLVAKEELTNKISVDSAGTGKWHVDKPPHEGTRDLLNQKGISYEGMKARQITAKDFKEFSYIIAMDDQNMVDLENQFKHDNQVVVSKLMDFVSHPEETNIPDPYFTGDFNYTYQLVSEGSKKLLKHIKENNNI